MELVVECSDSPLEWKYLGSAEMSSLSVGTSSVIRIGSANVLIVLLAAACPYGGC